MVTCIKLYALAKAGNSCNQYYGPLSLLTISGMSYLEKIVFNAVIVLVDVVEEISLFGYLE